MDGTFLDTLAKNINRLGEQKAFFIQGAYYTYNDLSKRIAGISKVLQQKSILPQTPVGVVAIDSIETYASILALWFNELIFIPISPSNAKSRTQTVMESTKLNYVLAPSPEDAVFIDLTKKELIGSRDLYSADEVLNINTNVSNKLYVLFTSGSTGTPKGVPISLQNLGAFVRAFYQIGYDVNQEDRFLQMFDFTFDVSIQSFVLPLYKGACIYTIPQKGIKYVEVLKTLQNGQVSFATMIPSILQFFQPIASKIDLPNLKYTIFTGEALSYENAKMWKVCAPNTAIENHYGPTEATIDCFYHRLGSAPEEHYQQIVSIGKPYQGIQVKVVNDNNKAVEAQEKGELLLSGSQVIERYLEEEYQDNFVQMEDELYYRTGDIVFRNEQGNYFYCGRKDNQVQVQGYRVELEEVTFWVKKVFPRKNMLVTHYLDKTISSLALFIEGASFGNRDEIIEQLSEVLPGYMLPQKIIFVSAFPLLSSGKVNVTALKESIND